MDVFVRQELLSHVMNTETKGLCVFGQGPVVSEGVRMNSVNEGCDLGELKKYSVREAVYHYQQKNSINEESL